MTKYPTIFCTDCKSCNNTYCDKYKCHLQKSNGVMTLDLKPEDMVKCLECYDDKEIIVLPVLAKMNK